MYNYCKIKFVSFFIHYYSKATSENKIYIHFLYISKITETLIFKLIEKVFSGTRMMILYFYTIKKNLIFKIYIETIVQNYYIETKSRKQSSNLQ